MAWLILFIAGLFETVWAVSLKYSDGFTRLWPTVITIAAMAVSLYLLALALKSLPLGSAYAVWTGVGALGAVIYRIIAFGESKDLLKLLFIAMILGGIIGLRSVSEKKSAQQKTEQGKAVNIESETSNNTPCAR